MASCKANVLCSIGEVPAMCADPATQDEAHAALPPDCPTETPDVDRRELVLKAITFSGPERIPFTYSVMPGALLRHGQELVRLCKRFPNDFYGPENVKVPQRDEAHYMADGSYFKEQTDEWGCVWVCYAEGVSGEVSRSPLSDLSELKRYRLPPVPGTSAQERKEAKDAMARMKEKYVGWGSAGSLFERMQWLRGVENLMIDIAEDRAEVYELADLLVEGHLIPRIELALEAGADVIGFSDDWGTQQQLLINPRSWRKIFKPRYKKLFERVHEGGAYAWLHSDGATLEIVPDWVEIGLDVLNPQLNCMDWRSLRRATAGRLCLAPDPDRQGCLAFGTPDEVRAHIKAIRDAFADKNGGLIFTGPVEEGQPLENIEALFQAFCEFRDA